MPLGLPSRQWVLFSQKFENCWSVHHSLRAFMIRTSCVFSLCFQTMLIWRQDSPVVSSSGSEHIVFCFWDLNLGYLMTRRTCQPYTWSFEISIQGWKGWNKYLWHILVVKNFGRNFSLSKQPIAVNHFRLQKFFGQTNNTRFMEFVHTS